MLDFLVTCGSLEAKENLKMSKRELPFEVEVDSFNEPQTIKNPLSGESIEIPADAVAVYDVVIGTQYMANPDWDLVRKGNDWFRQYEPKAYMVLLD